MLILLFAGLTAAKEVVAGSLVRNFDPLLLVCVTFFVTTSVFSVWLFIQPTPKDRPPLFARFGDVIALNFATLAGWGTVFFALQFIQPAVVSTLAVATLPLFSIVVQAMLSGIDRTEPVDVLGSILICISIGWVSWNAYKGNGIVIPTSQLALQLAILACILSGLGMAVSNVLARRLYRAGWKPGDIMARRFVLLSVAAGWLWVSGEGEIALVELADLVIFAAFGLIAIAVPIFILQKGLQTSAAVEAGAIISLSPILVLAFQILDPQITSDSATTVGVFVTVILVVLFLIMRDRTVARRTSR